MSIVTFNMGWEILQFVHLYGVNRFFTSFLYKFKIEFFVARHQIKYVLNMFS